MRKILSSIIVAASLVSCATTEKPQQVGYTEAHGYFVRNDAPVHAACYYDSRESFDSVFGCAAVMGKDGLPTEIDFDRQSVIAVIGSETSRPTEYRAVSLTQKSDTLRLRYKAKEQASTTYTMQPLLLLVIDKPSAEPCLKFERQ